MPSWLQSTQARFTALLLVFFLLVLGITVAVIQWFITPELVQNESELVRNEIDLQAQEITAQMNRVQAQQRSITELTAALPSAQIDELVPHWVNQYGDRNVFGGGIWPLPGQREAGRDKFSTFFARNAQGELEVNTVWNQPQQANYWEQPWHKDGMSAPKGQCIWAKAYQDEASPEPRTNCAMGIYRNGKAWGVATIDVTLGFFNQLAQRMGQAVEGQVLIVEADGKVVGNAALVGASPKLQYLKDLQTPMAAPLSALLAQAADGKKTTQSQYQGADGAHTLFLQPIAGSPWLVASDVPSALLSRQSSAILTRLALVQIPLAALLLAVMLLLVRRIMVSLQGLRQSIDKLSGSGADLTQRLPTSTTPEFNAVAESFNRFIAHLHELMQQVGQSTESIGNASREIASGNMDLASRTEQQSSSIVQTAASMEEMTSTVRQNADNAGRASELAGQASTVAQQGTQVVQQVVQTMGQINDSASKMQSIIAIIDGIAFQTNILALNAAVEAARAGEQGRGFAVVASEVRNLAQRSANSAREIKGLIEDSITHAHEGSALVRQAGSTMDELAQGIANVTTLMGEIMTASREQITGIEAANTAIGQIDITTQQNAALVEEVAAAAQSMESQVQQLEGVVRSFRL